MFNRLFKGILIFSLLWTLNCYGKFNLVREVYGINNKFNIGEPGGKVNGFGKSIFMIFLAILPVYSGAIIIDIAFLNLYEFWTGNNPLSTAENTHTSGSLSKGTSLKTYEDNGFFYIEVTENAETRKYRAKRDEFGILYREKQGNYTKIQVEEMNFGSVRLVEAEGKLHAISEKGALLF